MVTKGTNLSARNWFAFLLVMLAMATISIMFNEVVEHAPEWYCYIHPTFQYCYWKQFAWTRAEQLSIIIESLVSIALVLSAVLTVNEDFGF